jgi:hypothetical protein
MLRPVVSRCASGVSAAGLELLECEGEGPERRVPCELQVAACRPGWAAQECAGRGAGPRQAMEQGSHGGRELLDRMLLSTKRHCHCHCHCRWRAPGLVPIGPERINNPLSKQARLCFLH